MLSAFHSIGHAAAHRRGLARSERGSGEWRHQARASGLFFVALMLHDGRHARVLFRQMDDKRNAEQALSDARHLEVGAARRDQRAAVRRARGRAARTRRGGSREHAQGRIPHDALARAAHAADGDSGLGPHAGLGRAGRRPQADGDRDHRAQRPRADAADRRSARRVAGIRGKLRLEVRDVDWWNRSRTGSRPSAPPPTRS